MSYNEYTKENKIVKPEDAARQAIKLIQLSRQDKVRRDSQNLVLQRLFERGFEINPYGKGAAKITSKMLQQVLWKCMNRRKPLDVNIFGTNRPVVIERLVTDGVATVMRRGSYDETLSGKGGLFQKSFMWGDGWAMFGKNHENGVKKQGVPIIFMPISNSNIYFDPYSTKMRGAWGQSVRQCVVIFSYSWERACSLYPDLKKKKGAPGRIPRDLTYLKELERTFLQTTQIKATDLIEVGHFWDLDQKIHCEFAGPTLTPLEFYQGKEYPYYLHDEAFIPVIHDLCQPSSEGMYNHGIFDMVFDLAVISAQLMNMAVGHAEDNVYPITIINAPQAEASKFMNKLRVAHEMRQAGKKGYVVSQYGAGNTPNPVTASSLTTQSLWQEWQNIYETITREVARLGINLDEIDRGNNGQVTASQIMAEEESASAFIKQIGEYNANEAEFAVNITMQMIAENIDDDDDTPLDLTTSYSLNNDDAQQLANATGKNFKPLLGPVKVKGKDITLGMIAQELRRYNYFCKANKRSGVVFSQIYKQAQAKAVLQYAPPGSKAYTGSAAVIAQANDMDYNEDDFGMPQAQAPVPGQPTTPSETDRNAVNPNAKEPIMA